MTNQSQVFTVTNQNPESNTKKPSSKYTWKKILLAVVLAVITSGLVVFAVLITNPQIGAVLTVKMKFPNADNNPAVYTVPEERALSTNLKGNEKFPTIEHNGIKLTAPWVEDPKEEVKNDVKFFMFVKNDAWLMPLKADLLGDLKPTISSEDGDKIKLLYGEEILESNYSFYKAIMEVNPDDLHIFRARNEAVAESLLIIYKATLAIHIDGGVFSFQNDKIKGFQFGNADISNGVEVNFFDTNDTPYSLGIFGATQKEVDFILNSIEIIGK